MEKIEFFEKYKLSLAILYISNNSVYIRNIYTLLGIYIMNCVLRIFVAFFGLYRPIKSAIGVRSGRNFVYIPQIHPFDDPEIFSLIGPAS